MTTAPWILALLACGQADIDTHLGETGDTGEPVAEPLYDDADLAAIEAAATTALSDSYATGAQVAVWLDGAIVYQGQFGSAHPEAAVEITPDTLFQIGSDTKKMTALALLQQAESGALAVEDSVAQTIPGLSLDQDPGWAGAATLHHLLSHQGGMFDYTPWHHLPDDAELADVSYGEFAEREWIMAPPGTTWNYSNPNFSLAGLATEIAAGRPWADALEGDLFAPLGMTRSVARRVLVEGDGDVAAGTGYRGWSDDAFDPFFASGTYSWGTAEVADCTDNAFTRPAGLVWSTATDMATLGGFLVEGDPAVLDDTLREALTTSHVQLYPSWDGYGYGYGLMVLGGLSLTDGYHATETWIHGGNTLAFTSNTTILPEHRLSVSVLSNGYGSSLNGLVATLVERADLFTGTDDPPEVPAEEPEPEEVVGTYTDPYVGTIQIGENMGRLTIAIPDLAAMGIPVGAALNFAGITDVYTFSLGGSPYELVFIEEGGEYRYARNRLFVGTRVEELTETSPRPREPGSLAVRLAEARLSPLALPR